MSKYVVAVFPDESKAYEGKRAFQALDNEGSPSVVGRAGKEFIMAGYTRAGDLRWQRRLDCGPGYNIAVDDEGGLYAYAVKSADVATLSLARFDSG